MPIGVRQPKGKSYAGDIPFNLSGGQLHFADNFATRQGLIRWKPNFTFHGELRFRRFNRGRSAAYAEFERLEHGEARSTVTVFLADLAVMLLHMRDGVARGEFTFCKRGQNYGCKMVSA